MLEIIILTLAIPLLEYFNIHIYIIILNTQHMYRVTRKKVGKSKLL